MDNFKTSCSFPELFLSIAFTTLTLHWAMYKCSCYEVSLFVVYIEVDVSNSNTNTSLVLVIYRILHIFLNKLNQIYQLLTLTRVQKLRCHLRLVRIFSVVGLLFQSMCGNILNITKKKLFSCFVNIKICN